MNQKKLTVALHLKEKVSYFLVWHCAKSVPKERKKENAPQEMERKLLNISLLGAGLEHE